jgi:hypothetical protein
VQMRKALVPFLILLALPAAAYASSDAGPPPTRDGTLSVREGRGIVQLSARGTVTGRFDRGKITVTDPNPYDDKRPVVFGSSKTVYRGDKTTIYQGRNIRFRLSGAMFHTKIEGRGIFLSAIGQGRGLIDGAGDTSAGIFYDGVWSLNDEPYHSLPDDETDFELVTPTPG